MSTLALIVAVAKNGVIGRDGALPWHLGADLQWFKQCTTGNAIVMGRKTYESIGKALPERHNIVISRNPDLVIDGCTVCANLESAAAAANAQKTFVIGGAQIYREAISRAGELYLTVVNAEVAGDTWFPFVDFDDWQLMSRATHSADERNDHDCEFRVYRRLT